MLTINCSHPDIEEFINLKTKKGVCEKANISVKVSDDFMIAVLEDKEWVTEFTSLETGTITKTFRARDLLKLIAKRNWEWAEPGMLYWDRITKYNMLNNNVTFRLSSTNPCGELPLPDGGSCLLGSINLSEFVINPFTPNASIDNKALIEAVDIAIKALNTVLDEGADLHPLEEQRESVRDWRQIGLGTFGMADMLIKLGVKYGSAESIDILKNVYRLIAVTAVCKSNELAAEYGAFPMCNNELLAESNFIEALDLPNNILDNIRRFGLRNGQLLTCAPTGSIATMLEASSGVEPHFALRYTRRTQSLDGKDTYYDVLAKIVCDYIGVRYGEDIELPDYFVESKDIDPIDRIKVQAVLQKYIDNSISSTINLPENATVEDVYKIYIEAWRNGLKGCTIYRQGCLREGILTTKKPLEIPTTSAPKRPEELPCDIHQVTVKGEQFIVCVGKYNDSPYEVFVFRLRNRVTLNSTTGTIRKHKKGVYSLISSELNIVNLLETDISIEEKAATLYSSMLLRHGISIKYIIKTAKKVNDNISSFSSAMCRVLAKYMPVEKGGTCPECGAEIIHSGGCQSCPSCGWSKCG